MYIRRLQKCFSFWGCLFYWFPRGRAWLLMWQLKLIFSVTSLVLWISSKRPVSNTDWALWYSSRVPGPVYLKCYVLWDGNLRPSSSPNSEFVCVSFEGGKGLWNMNYLHLLVLNMLLTHEWQQSREHLQPFSADVTVTMYVEVFTKEKNKWLIQSLSVLPNILNIFLTNTFFIFKEFNIFTLEVIAKFGMVWQLRMKNVYIIFVPV